jgi:hypothetical protein
VHGRRYRLYQIGSQIFQQALGVVDFQFGGGILAFIGVTNYFR